MGGINDLVLTRSQRYVVSVGQDRKIVIWDVRTNDPIFQRTIDDENDEGLAIAESHDGRYFVTGGSAGILRIWTLVNSNQGVSLQLVSDVRGHSKGISSVAFSMNDKQVVSAGDDGSIFVWWFIPEGGSGGNNNSDANNYNHPVGGNVQENYNHNNNNYQQDYNFNNNYSNNCNYNS